jgi:hypothetical protein
MLRYCFGPVCLCLHTLGIQLVITWFLYPAGSQSKKAGLRPAFFVVVIFQIQQFVQPRST